MKIAASALLLAATLPALADDTPWLRCRSVVDPAARLACYDAVKPASAAPRAPAAGAAAAAPTAAASPEARFGMERRSADELDEIRSVLPGRFEGWEPRHSFKLANGQVWQSVEGSRGYYVLESPKVRVRRGALGSFQLEIEGVAQVIRVRRVE